MQILEDYDSEEDDAVETPSSYSSYSASSSSATSSSTSSSSASSSSASSTSTGTGHIEANSFFSPRVGAHGASNKVPAARRGSRIFKQIDILESDGNSDDEEDYQPPKNYTEDSDDDSASENSAESGNENDAVNEIAKNVPDESKLSRKRKLKTSSGIYKRKGDKRTTSKRAKTAFDRVKEFAGEQLTVVNGKLSCRACCIQDLSLKKSSIANHVKGESHKRNMERRGKSQLTLLDYKRIVVGQELEESTAGATLSLDANAYRMTVCHALLKSGTPSTILDSGSEIRTLFEDGHVKCPKQACSDMIPLLNRKEHEDTIKELDDVSAFSISSDGTINVAEAFAVVRDHWYFHVRNNHLE